MTVYIIYRMYLTVYWPIWSNCGFMWCCKWWVSVKNVNNSSGIWEILQFSGACSPILPGHCEAPTIHDQCFRSELFTYKINKWYAIYVCRFIYTYIRHTCAYVCIHRDTSMHVQSCTLINPSCAIIQYNTHLRMGLDRSYSQDALKSAVHFKHIDECHTSISRAASTTLW